MVSYHMTSLASQLALLYPSYETGITGGLPHLASIYVSSRDQTQVLTLSGQLFSP